MSDISLLPEGLRSQEGAMQKHKAVPSAEPSGLKMHVPQSTADEDIEIIEVDESDLGAILADEPIFTRLSYQLSVALDSLKQKLFQQDQTPPPKLPPQFFTPPKPGLVTKSSASGSIGGVAASGPTGTAGGGPGGGALRSKARITPQSDVPRRVRVIRRVRKPVRISLLSAEELLAFQVDVPRRKWTLAVCAVLFLLVIGGGYLLLSARVADARTALGVLNQNLEGTRSEIQVKEQEWSRYRDLQRRLTVLDDLLNNHVVITRTFDFLERYTLPQVYYKSATMSPQGALSLDVTAESYAVAARQLVAFQKSAIVTRVEALSFSASAPVLPEGAAPPEGQEAAPVVESAKRGAVSFQLILQIDPNVLHGPIKNELNVTSTKSVAPSS